MRSSIIFVKLNLIANRTFLSYEKFNLKINQSRSFSPELVEIFSVFFYFIELNKLAKNLFPRVIYVRFS